MPLGTVLSFELAQADGICLPGPQESATDLAVPAPGLPIVLERAFYPQISQRYAVGPLGRGWSSNWDICAATASDGTVQVTGPGESARVFPRDVRGGFLASPGETATLSDRSTGGYLLREANGQVTAFRADGKLDYVEDTNGNCITASYSGSLLTSLKHSSGQTVQIAYNAAGRIQTITDPYKRVMTPWATGSRPPGTEPPRGA